ncbi:acyl-CoA/acyl-ACP dehydrogenase [Planotetraspora sp. A-T 1434]|uniref:acyl-CoA dehydrogenase family protein n=1 Tax=Planotetraspora sp. A-T 1434 TaxID=2979219 RepID=UPI0021BE456F|nr:acyl-CoA dehydrogenase family protein [Planotetraspora sp. A-T 1434]MCT9930333.1 acyl-CoA/acyl-ACP dehydrogenase [Planotetraspora sp. A-T 1434]
MTVRAGEFARALAGIAERAERHDREASFPHEAFDDLHRAGVLTLTLPKELDGGGAGLAETAAVLGEVGKADPSVGLVTAQHLMAHAALARPDNPWPASVRERVQRSNRDGVALINALRVEPDLGTPARGGLPATVAARSADGWRVTGHKIYSTGIPALRWLSVWARTDDENPLVGAFLVEAGTPGYRVEETWDHLGMRATRSDDVIFTGAWIPAGHAVDVNPPGAPPAGRGLPFLAWNNVLLSAVYDGVARAARDWLVRYLNERVPANLGRPLASLPRFQAAVGEIEALLLTNSRLLSATAAAVDSGEPVPDSGLVKYTVTGNAIRAVEIGIALIGNPGLHRGNPIERHYRDVLCSRIHTPQDDTILTGAGAHALSEGSIPT